MGVLRATLTSVSYNTCRPSKPILNSRTNGARNIVACYKNIKYSIKSDTSG